MRETRAVMRKQVNSCVVPTAGGQIRSLEILRTGMMEKVRENKDNEDVEAGFASTTLESMILA